MTFRKSVTFVLLILLCSFGAAARQISVVEFPLTLANSTDTLYVGWVGGFGSNPLNPDNAEIRFSRNPGGGDLSKYMPAPVAALEGLNNVPPSVVTPLLPLIKGTAFRPIDQGGRMGPGVYYCVAVTFRGSGSNRDTLVSNEFPIMVDAPSAPRPIGPSGRNITNLTPTFTWERPANADVPYYHVILSDEPLPVNLDDINDPKLEGELNIVWQAITPRTSITYGEPDPSGIITASPPPLSPGKTYSWLVFSNFGNHPAFSSRKFSLPQPFLEFTIAGTPLNKPENRVSGCPNFPCPVNRATFNSNDNPVIEFAWTNLDTNASAYLVNLLIDANPHDLGLGDDIGDMDIAGSLLVWETTVSSAGKKQNETLTARLDAVNTLMNGSYRWRVFALDSRGAGTAGDPSFFKYERPAGTLIVSTREVVGKDGDDKDIEARVGIVELRSEVLSGPMEKPLAFYTDLNGDVERERPVGTYRITAVKEGYRTETRTVSVRDGETTPLDIYMERPKATIFGRVTDTDDIPLNLASVTAVSEWGDTVRALTNGSGNFTLSCSDADWTVTVDMPGYRSSSPRKVSLKDGDHHPFGIITLERNPIVLSGSVLNPSGTPVIGVRVRIFREGTLVNELASTPQSGNFSFSLAAGVYTLTAEKAGFTTHSGEITVSGSRIQNITLRPGAALINGAVIGRSWSGELDRYVEAPVPSARVRFWETGSADTVAVTADAVFGNFNAGLEGGKTYNYASGAAGFVAGRTRTVRAESNQTHNITDTLYSLAMISGITSREAAGSMGGVDVVVFDRDNNRVAATGRSSSNGSFEVRNIPDGNFSVNAAMTGFYLDGGARNFTVSNGKPEGLDLNADPLILKPGEVEIRLRVADGSGEPFRRNQGAIKVASPFMRAFTFIDTLKNAGPGNYIVEAEANDTTYLNLSSHTFTVPEGVTVHPVQLSLPFMHMGQDTLKPDGIIKVSGSASAVNSISSARLFYRSEGSAAFSSIAGAKGVGNEYTFTFPDARDGSNLYYYFRVNTQSGDVYGSQKQIYRSFIEPEPTVISRIEIIPGVSDGDTLLLPSSYSAQFSFRAFYSSSFIPLAESDMSTLANSVRWSLEGKDRADCSFEGSNRGLNAAVRTGSRESKEVTLAAKLDLPSNSRFRLAPNLRANLADTTCRLNFKVTGSVLESISILRTDPKAPEAISNTEEAAFRAVGVDKKGEMVTVSPRWTIEPAAAGSISGDGKFTPVRKYVGGVRVFAAVGNLRAEFNPVDRENKVTNPGLSVSYVLRHSASADDTVSNLKGLRIAFPAGSIGAGEVEQFEVSIPDMRNQMKKSSGNLRVADSVAFDIVPRGGNAKLNFGSGDNGIAVILNVPSHLIDKYKKKPENFHVAWWNPVRLEWQTTDKNGKKINSARNDSTVSAAVSHFSEYALVMNPEGFNATLNISPNPFSPFIRPVREHGQDAPAGTCIRVGIATQGQRAASLKVHIYNAVGHRVWAVEKLSPEVGEHKIWWDGRTSTREEMWVENFNENNKRGAMARNGRYFVTVIVKNYDGEVKRVMKPVVLMK